MKPFIKWSTTKIGNEIHGGEVPIFPDVLPGWRLEREWRATVRAFADQWVSLRTANGEFFREYPATMNGCGNHRFRLRWRSISGGPVRFACGTVGSDIGTIVEHELPEPVAQGWAQLHGCGWPLWRYMVQRDGSNLGDITVEVQHWEAAV
ncbi:hypothetical protein E1193_15245 [Micromonospora sp. KC606]|uniref:hypothetical protein n=1 Tax=Micromonospora sp. KC606 TaxID=2530379 RepID=UPI00104675AD|nr:hypothetical protein [Micromonospora sp. KC606]TDC81266.1 hypothetical protein E1193_15245 [Micromonospora sp. KC606]